jgi:hypothetical protein
MKLALQVFNKDRLIILFSPLRAEQVSEANLRSEQGGINFTPFGLFLPYAKKKFNFPYG